MSSDRMFTNDNREIPFCKAWLRREKLSKQLDSISRDISEVEESLASLFDRKNSIKARLFSGTTPALSGTWSNVHRRIRDAEKAKKCLEEEKHKIGMRRNLAKRCGESIFAHTGASCNSSGFTG